MKTEKMILLIDRRFKIDGNVVIKKAGEEVNVLSSNVDDYIRYGIAKKTRKKTKSE